MSQHLIKLASGELLLVGIAFTSVRKLEQLRLTTNFNVCLNLGKQLVLDDAILCATLK